MPDTLRVLSIDGGGIRGLVPALVLEELVAARATSAAPTYFEPARVANLTIGRSMTLVDGGVYANNPESAKLDAIVERL